MSKYHSHTMSAEEFQEAKEHCKGPFGHDFEDITSLSEKRGPRTIGWPFVLRCTYCTTERSEGRSWDGRVIVGTREYDWPEGWNDPETSELKRGDWSKLYLERTQGKHGRRPAEKIRKSRKAS